MTTDDATITRRPPGLYWVRLLGTSNSVRAEWTGLNWFIVGKLTPYTDDALVVISRV